jgi:hypothetical protein
LMFSSDFAAGGLQPTDHPRVLRRLSR